MVSPRRRLALSACFLASLVAMLLPAAADAHRAPCYPGSKVRCHAWMATVLRRHGDGDTIFVHVDGGAPGYRRVRFAGINTQEMHRYSTIYSRQRGECHAIAATRFLWSYLRKSHWRVRLTARHASSHSGTRLRRHVSVRLHGHWVDVEALELNRGLALWLPNAIEWPFNKNYNLLSQLAAKRGVGLWNPRGCGRGPSPNAQLRVLARWSANVSDSLNLNGESMIVQNLGDTPVRLGHWVLRNGGAIRYHFPSGAVVAPHDQVVLHTGRGHDNGHDFYFGHRAPYLDNIQTGHTHLASGAYLFDPRGNIRAHQTYPCMVDCHAALAGKLKLRVHPRKPEYAEVQNVAATPVDLEGYRVQVAYLSYWFANPTILQPGERLRIYGVRSEARRARSSARLVRSWNLHRYLLRDRYGAGMIATFDDIRVTCVTWGRGSCRQLP